MDRLGHLMSASIVAIVLGLTASAHAGEFEKHSGSIVSIADDVRTFVLAEVGPWQVRDGVTVMTYRTITLAPETTFALVERGDQPPSGFRGDFVETPLRPDDVFLNDYVTVECRREGKRLVAQKITKTGAGVLP